MTTPARRQYLDIKAQHQDAILLYQIGDFYETFDEDARTAARELQIVLTSRSYGPGERVPLAGVPVHAVDTYAARLVAAGYIVAICDQVSPPGKGLVRREVTRILTPGTVVEPNMLPSNRDNYLVAVAFGSDTGTRRHQASAGLACVDVSSGTFTCTQWAPGDLPDTLRAELDRLAPAEVLVSQHEAAPDGASPLVYEHVGASWLSRYTLRDCPDHYFDAERADRELCRHFGVATLDVFGCRRRPLAVAAAGAIVAYLQRMNPALASSLVGLRYYSTDGFVAIDPRTWRALEAVEPASVEPMRDGRSPARTTLLDILDATRTAMGARLLRRTLLQPLKDRAAIESRLGAVAELHANPWLRETLGSVLDGVADVERLVARVIHGSATPRELHALAASLDHVPPLRSALATTEAAALRALATALDPCEHARDLIRTAVADPQSDSRRTLLPGYSAELDTLIEGAASARQWIAALESTERERTGIKSLKVGFNSVFGYYIEVTRPNLDHVPPDYQRRQTLAHAERYVTAELKEHEALVLHAEEQIATLERTLYAELLRELSGFQARLRATAASLAQLDVWLSLALVALARGYVRPELTDTPELAIHDGRHPIVEAALDAGEFIPNDTILSADSIASGDTARVLLLTGPNMAGKSTVLRQVASTVLLAQIGSFVPARNARIGIVDRICARVGAEDDLARGLSTFMLEMVETGYILRHATSRSLIILDEVGRGTSTVDGLAIARAVIEHLHDAIGARTLFATHYGELAILARTLPGLRIYRMAVAERDGEAVFLHRVVPGVSDSSYGVQVARMAGLPPRVTERAATLIEEARMPAVSGAIAESSAAYTAPAPREPAPPDDAPHDDQFALALASLNLAAMTPIEALNILFSLQQQALACLHVEAR